MQNYGHAVVLPLTNETMASFLREWKKRLPHLRLQIGKKSRADLIEKIRAFAIANPAVQLAEGDDTMEVEEEMTPSQSLAALPTSSPSDARK
ncbi:uncharacterized protein ACA1_091030 [Acanthamoeba castellanii str. Neff]|uniref:Uncharacterized protein n=1 Tax=Acanthamoeba castellanii (strain ATCC 30010 / Neff) TaxID=1257118 RepID=L8GIP7_ACACF|nr:uncharacterized protein ACA1_091030 [Acanthamoeba castellanii str. Neff]ELR12603.1 hypothetical protein ACA1_091030 [Acanthamoeba castellanii str. Neff]